MEVSGRRKRKDNDDHTTGILCDPCGRVNEEENAVFYCTVCNEFLCHDDARAHRKNAMTMDHTLLDRDSMPKQKIGSYEDNICPIHKGELLKYICNPHSTSCCSICATKEHMQCKVECIDDIAKGYEMSSEYTSLIRDMTNLTHRLHNARQHSVDNKKKAQHIHTDIVAAIRKFREEINGIIDSLENASLKEAKITIDAESKAAETIMSECDTLTTNLQEMISTSENLRKFKQERQLVIHSKNARVQVNGFKAKVSTLSDDNRRKDFKFIPDKKIRQLLRSLKSLGRLDIMEESTKPKESNQKTKTVPGAKVSVPVVTPRHVRDINIQHSTDTFTDYRITGGVMMDKNKLALTDFENCNVKVVDVISNTVTSCITLPSEPWDITRVEQDQVVVICYGGKLAFLKVGNTLSIVKQLDLGGCMRGFAFTNNTLVIGCGFPDSCVRVIDLRGRTLKTFKTDALGHNLFQDPRHIALSEDQNTIFVLDLAHHRVTSLRMDGTVRGIYTDDNLKCPSGLAVDRNDNVYVAGKMSNNIHQLSRECKPIRVLLDNTHGIKHPWMVTYCKAGHKLYIGNNLKSKGNLISVFQLH